MRCTSPIHARSSPLLFVESPAIGQPVPSKNRLGKFIEPSLPHPIHLRDWVHAQALPSCGRAGFTDFCRALALVLSSRSRAKLPGPTVKLFSCRNVCLGTFTFRLKFAFSQNLCILVSMHQGTGHSQPVAFTTTHWTVVLTASNTGSAVNRYDGSAHAT